MPDGALLALAPAMAVARARQYLIGDSVTDMSCLLGVRRVSFGQFGTQTF